MTGVREDICGMSCTTVMRTIKMAASNDLWVFSAHLEHEKHEKVEVSNTRKLLKAVDGEEGDQVVPRGNHVVLLKKVHVSTIT